MLDAGNGRLARNVVEEAILKQGRKTSEFYRSERNDGIKEGDLTIL